MTEIEDSFGDIADDMRKTAPAKRIGKTAAARANQLGAEAKFVIRRSRSQFSTSRCKHRADANLRRF